MISKKPKLCMTIICFTILIGTPVIAGWDHTTNLEASTPIMPSPLTGTSGGVTWDFSSSTTVNAWYIKGELYVSDTEADIGSSKAGSFSVSEEWDYSGGTPPETTFKVHYTANIPALICQSKKKCGDDAANATFKAKCSVAADSIFNDSCEKWAIASREAVELKSDSSEPNSALRKGINVSAQYELDMGHPASWSDALSAAIQFNWGAEVLNAYVSANEGSDNTSENWIDDVTKSTSVPSSADATLSMELSCALGGSDGDCWWWSNDSKTDGEVHCTKFKLECT